MFLDLLADLINLLHADFEEQNEAPENKPRKLTRARHGTQPRLKLNSI